MVYIVNYYTDLISLSFSFLCVWHWCGNRRARCAQKEVYQKENVVNYSVLRSSLRFPSFLLTDVIIN